MKTTFTHQSTTLMALIAICLQLPLAAQQPSIQRAPGMSNCVGSIQAFNLTNCNQCSSIIWHLGPDASSPTVGADQSVGNFYWTTPGSKNVSVDYADPTGQHNTYHDPIVVEKAIPLEITLSVVASICEGNGISMSATLKEKRGIQIYHYYLDGSSTPIYVGPLSSLSLPSSGLAAGIHTVQVLVINKDYACFSNHSAWSSVKSFEINLRIVQDVTMHGPIGLCASNPGGSFYVTVQNPVGNLSYKWYRVFGGNRTEIDGETGSIYNRAVPLLDGEKFECEVVTTGCAVSPVTSSYTVTLTPDQAPSVAIHVPRLTYCDGEAITFKAEGNNLGANTTIEWLVNGNRFATTNPATLIASATHNVGKFYPGSMVELRATGFQGTCLNGDAAIDDTNDTPIAVYGRPELTATSPGICSGATTSIAITPTNSVQPVSYSWTVTTSDVTGAQAGDGYTIAQTLSTIATTSETVDYYITGNSNGCAGSTFHLSVLVIPAPSLLNAAADFSPQSICSGEPVHFVPQTLQGAEVNWSLIASANIAAASLPVREGTGALEVFPVNTGPTTATVTSLMFPTYKGCRGPESKLTVSVKPLPAISTTVTSAKVCSGQVFKFGVTNEGGVENTFVDWSVSAPGVTGIFPSEIPRLVPHTILHSPYNNSSQIKTVEYFLKPRAEGCLGKSVPVSLSVFPTPSISVKDSRIFSGQAMVIQPSASGCWDLVDYSVVDRLGVSNAFEGVHPGVMEQVLSTTGEKDGYVSYRLTPFFKGCQGPPASARVDVFRTPELSRSRERIGKGTDVVLATTAPYDSYVWYRDNVTISNASTVTTRRPGNYHLTVTRAGASTTTPPVHIEEILDGQGWNFIVAERPSVKGIFNTTGLSLLGVDSVTQSVQYFDGLGRLVEKVETQGTSTREDLRTPVTYDAVGREWRKFLPVALDNTGRRFESLEGDRYAGQANDFYSGSKATVPADNSPYTETVYESSSLGRVLEQGSPGEVWQPGTGHTTKRRYEVNRAGDVLHFVFNRSTGRVALSPSAATYPAGVLYANISYDEHDNEAIEYVDLQARTICKKVLHHVSGSPPDEVRVYASTYYVYDEFGNLVIVLSPEAVKQITSQL